MEDNMKADSQEDLYQIVVLIDQLKHDDSNLRAHAISCLPRIAKALGPERTRVELIPFLTDTTDDEDDILVLLAKNLGELRNYVGGEDYFHILLLPLEILLSSEDANVREEAINSLDKITESCRSKEFLSHIVESFNKLASKDWHTSRMSAATIFKSLHKHLNDNNQRLRTTFYSLCEDESALVRRSATSVLSVLLKELSLPDIMSEVVPLFKRLATDDQDNVRIQVIRLAVALSNILPDDAKVAHILPVVLSLSSDRSWRVRWSFCGFLLEICGSYGAEITSKNFSIVFETLLCDSEVEVRASFSSTIASVAKYFSKEVVINKIIPGIHNLVSDTSEHVRVSLASSLTAMAQVLGKAEIIEHLLPLLLLLLRDDASEVRLNILSSLEAINAIIGIDALNQALLPCIFDLAEDPKWRVRLAIIELIPKLAQQLGNGFFDDKLNNVCISWLTDRVYTVRETATNNICKLVRLFGENWAVEYVFPRLDKMLTQSNYLHRVTALHCVESLIPICSESVIEKYILVLLVNASKDPVANVRFTLAKVVSKMPANTLTISVKSDLNSVICKLSEDSDCDVSFFADKAYKLLTV